MSSDALTDRMIVLARNLNRGLSDILDGCYAVVTPDLRYLRLDKSGRTIFVEQKKFKDMDDKSIVAILEKDFSSPMEGM